MKSILTIALLFAAYIGYSQSEEIAIPQNTLITMELSQEVKEGRNKVGEAARFVVAQDVAVNGITVIAKGSLVHATVTTSKRGELRVDLHDVAAADGTVVKLNDCWIFTTAAQNYHSHGALLVKGTKKNCTTPSSYTVKKSGGKY
jgi:hypothetical protein